MEKEDYCVICETVGVETIALKKIEFNGDLIPVCDFHYNTLENNPELLDLLDE